MEETSGRGSPPRAQSGFRGSPSPASPPLAGGRKHQVVVVVAGARRRSMDESLFDFLQATSRNNQRSRNGTRIGVEQGRNSPNQRRRCAMVTVR
jgi:hypothetical protein